MSQPPPGREATVLLSWLDGQRDHVLGILEGLGDADLRRAVLPTGWSCLGLVHHLAVDVERWWFRYIFSAEPLVFDGGAWTVPEGVSAEEVFALYREEIDRSNAIVRAHRPDAAPTGYPDDWPLRRYPDLRELIVHVMTETANHAGHLDAVRELIDGRTWLVLD
ncbi:MAG TPA: DinB family protein [Candidatus Dormibacteraeota bacterium]|jgi:hypothetical protein|nr:DinB family protein [Candidatus Dormibacteraeota bacterium]